MAVFPIATRSGVSIVARNDVRKTGPLSLNSYWSLAMLSRRQTTTYNWSRKSVEREAKEVTQQARVMR